MVDLYLDLQAAKMKRRRVVSIIILLVGTLCLLLVCVAPLTKLGG